MRLGKALATGVAEERPHGTHGTQEAHGTRGGQRPGGETVGGGALTADARTAGPAPAAEEVPAAR